MLGFWAYAVAATMTAVAVWRLPAVLYGDSHRRALWGCYVGFAAALWLKSPAVESWLNNSPIVDLSILLKHYVSTAALLAILTYVVASYGRSDEAVIPRHVAVARWIERVAWKAAIGQLALMTVLFFTVVNRSHPSVDFVPDHAGQWGASTYESIFYIYLGASSAVTCYQWSSAARRAETRLLRTGLVLMAVAMAIGVLYVFIRTAFMWVAVFHHLSHGFDDGLGKFTEAMQIVLFFLFAVGVSIPTTDAAATRWRSWRTLWRLYPLWRDLMTAFPGTALQPPASRWREAARTSPPLDVRLDRCTQDIADAVDQLRHYAPPTLLFAAEDAAAAGADPQPAAEALWIRAALAAVAAGERNDEASPALPSKPISDSDAEASWLLRVQQAYAQADPDQARELREAAKEYAR
ncbi:MAB_1171c family putative transporter [Kitasatospora mediocidica]|uniref:MAB_1171c family putative transporter n=1 Tax=Kitasatospora mediocidica TaxID=58352 RepID=UPI000568CBA8|nr:MAB_1171c family putative transporter [Kitasatospora mediocidica]